MKQVKWLFYLLFYKAAWCFSHPCVFDFTKEIHVESSFSSLFPIDAIYVINLDERPERWERLKSLLDEQNLMVYRFSGINGWKLSEKIKKRICGPYQVSMSNGHFGCLLSHLSVIKDAYEKKFQMVWILEDDVEFLSRADSFIPEFLKELEEVDPNWDVLYTDTDFRDRIGGYTKAFAICPRPDQKAFPLSYYLQRPKVSKSLYRVFNRYGLTSYILSIRGLEKIYHYFNCHYVYSPIDCDIHYIPNLRQYCPGKDFITNTRFGTSDTIYNELANLE